MTAGVNFCECSHEWKRHERGPAPPEARGLHGCLDCPCTKRGPTGTAAIKYAVWLNRGGMDAPARSEGSA